MLTAVECRMEEARMAASDGAQTAEAFSRIAGLAASFTREGMLDEARAAEASGDGLLARACRAVATEVLTPGMPLAALPVESLYKQWSAGSAEMAAARGLYLGDAAHHIMSVYGKCGIEVPTAFSAMPDHIALVAELAAMLSAAGNAEAARRIAADHFDWLAGYDAALADRASRIAARCIGRAGDPAADPLWCGIALLRQRLTAIDDSIRAIIR